MQSLEDIVVPLAQIPELVEALEGLSAQYDVLIPCYGHAGDGNLHATPVKKPETPLDEWEEKLPALLSELYTRGPAPGRHDQRRARRRLQAAGLPAAGDGRDRDRLAAADQGGV